jgi:hypothetical protein
VKFGFDGHTPTKILRDDITRGIASGAELLGEPLRQGFTKDSRVRLLVLPEDDREGRRLEFKQRALLYDA